MFLLIISQNSLTPFSLQTLGFFFKWQSSCPYILFIISAPVLISVLRICTSFMLALVLTHIFCFITFFLILFHVLQRAPPVCLVCHCLWAVVVPLFTALDADLNSAIAFCLSWNSFVDSTGFFLNLCL